MVEFAALLLPLLLIVVAIIQFGFLFAAYAGWRGGRQAFMRAA